MTPLRTAWLVGILVLGSSGCAMIRDTRFVDVPRPGLGTSIAVIDANEKLVRLRISGPNEPVFLALVEPRVMGDGLYLFPSYITKPIVSEQLEVPVLELDLPAEWRDRIFWVEAESETPWYRIFRARVRTIERRHLELPETAAAGD